VIGLALNAAPFTVNEGGSGLRDECDRPEQPSAYIPDICPTNPAAWFKIVAVSTNLPDATPVAGNGRLFSLSDTNAASVRFYRVTVRVP
jgi:hypothetical protein